MEVVVVLEVWLLICISVFFSNVCIISVKLLMYMRTSCTKIYSSIRVFFVYMVSKIGLFLLCKSGLSLFATGWSYSSERLFYIEGMGYS